MEDLLICPICQNKLKNRLLRPNSNSPIPYFERTCTSGKNHSFHIKTNNETKLIEFLKFSLESNFSKIIEFDFKTKTCKITCLKNNYPHYINVDKLLDIDFPELTSLKEKVDTYIAFS